MTLFLALGHLSISQVSLPFSLLFITSSPPNVLRALLPFCTHLRPRNFLIIPSFSRSLLQATFSSHSFHFASFPLRNYLRSFPFSLISLPLIVPHSRRTKILLSCGHPEIALSYHTPISISHILHTVPPTQRTFYTIKTEIAPFSRRFTINRFSLHNYTSNRFFTSRVCINPRSRSIYNNDFVQFQRHLRTQPTH